MSGKIKLIFILLIAIGFVSGCIFDSEDENKDSNPTSNPGIFPETGLPSGYIFMGIHETELDIRESMIKATEAVYRDGNGDDVYIQSIEDDDPLSLMNDYKQRYKNAKYAPFKEISFNSHAATQITDYLIFNGNQKPYYSVIWATEKSLIIVGSSPDPIPVLELAKATGY